MCSFMRAFTVLHTKWKDFTFKALGVLSEKNNNYLDFQAIFSYVDEATPNFFLTDHDDDGDVDICINFE